MLASFAIINSPCGFKFYFFDDSLISWNLSVNFWDALDAEKGMQRYNEMIAELKSGMDKLSFEI